MRSHGRGVLAAVLCAAGVVVPQAQASQGHDTVYRWDYVEYTADPGEQNAFVAEDLGPGMHLNDNGAIIRWLSIPGLSDCAGGVHDVYCVDQYGFQMGVMLGDGNDTFVNRSSSSALVDLGPGDDSAVGGGSGYGLEGGLGADDLHGGTFRPELVGGPIPQLVTYEHATGPLSVTADNVANDGQPGESDNVHGDVYEVVGGVFDDTISGFASEDGGDGNDVLTGGAGRDNLFGGAGDDVFESRDGEADRIWCGTGTDVVHADAQDVIETPADCETVEIA
jgi:Ca2+-binding RTX toxin-like protein